MADNHKKSACKYGVQCYQRNEAHKNRFWHPSPEDDVKASDSYDVANKRSPEHSPQDKPYEKRHKPSNDSASIENDSSADSEAEESTPEEVESEVESEEAKTKNSIVKKDEPIVESTVTDPIEYDQSDDADQELMDDVTKANSVQIEFIRRHFLVRVPKDILLLWAFCRIHCSEFKCDPVHIFNKLGIRLVGPFDVFAGNFDTNENSHEPADFLRHWRFYYDPPEFQTVLVKTSTGIHYGIWRDDPMSTNVFYARNDAKNCEFTIIADNIFSALLHCLDKDVSTTMFNQRELTKLKQHLQNFMSEHNVATNSLHSKLKARNARSVCKTFHRAGLVVPFDRKSEVGYRPLIETEANLKKMLQKFSDADGDKELLAAAFDKLEPLITAANIACDESDFGNTIELGLALFCFGAPELYSAAQRLLQTGYTMINKPEFAAIVKAHLDNRCKDHSKLSIINANSKK